MTQRNDTKQTTHIYFLLDRTGSMASMAADVIGGFNGFLASQRAEPGFARMTLVQFDTVDPFEVIADGLPLNHVPELTHERFQPRGGTPLYDATAHLIGRAAGRVEERRALGRQAEDIVFVTFTDGEENSSVRYTRADVQRMVKAKEEAGWTFVFLGAGLDAYAEGGAIGHAAGSTQAFAPDGHGARLAYSSLDAAMKRHRAASPAARAAAKESFFVETGKSAEEDRRERY
ncbi:MAG TPA: vWA domain-containing protein [Acidimicrobiales bacterium]|nr:vWA domain-containing protein [Acidimicrobiales bacterium]